MSMEKQIMPDIIDQLPDNVEKTDTVQRNEGDSPEQHTVTAKKAVVVERKTVINTQNGLMEDAKDDIPVYNLIEDGYRNYECSCGHKTDSWKKMTEHVEDCVFNWSEKRDLLQKLSGVTIYGFEKSVAGHGGHPFYHKELNLTVYATPNYDIHSDKPSIQLSIHAGAVMIDSKTVSRDSQEQYTVAEFLKTVRDYIEEKLVTTYKPCSHHNNPHTCNQCNGDSSDN